MAQSVPLAEAVRKPLESLNHWNYRNGAINKNMKRQTLANIVVFCLLVVLGVVSRWIAAENQPSLTNFTAIGATALFAGYFFRSRLAALLLPLAAMAVSNLWLRQYDNIGQLVIVYVALIVPVAIGMLLKGNLRWWTLGIGAWLVRFRFI